MTGPARNDFGRDAEAQGINDEGTSSDMGR